MPVKSKSTIKRHLKELRTLIETTEDPVERRVAYAMEMAVRWATEDVTDWCGLVDEAKSEASLLKTTADMELIASAPSLRAHYEAAMANWTSVLSERDALRSELQAAQAENAALKDENGKMHSVLTTPEVYVGVVTEACEKHWAELIVREKGKRKALQAALDEAKAVIEFCKDCCMMELGKFDKKWEHKYNTRADDPIVEVAAAFLAAQGGEDG